MSRSRVIVALAMVFALALATRLGVTFAFKRWDDPGAGVHRQLAVNLVEFGAYWFREFGYLGPSSVVTPVYPTLLSGLFRLFGTENPTAYFSALALNALFGGFSAVVVAQLVRRAGAGDAVAIASGTVIAVLPTQVFAAQFVQPMALIALLATGGVLLWKRAERGSAGAWTAFAVTAGVTSLLEPALLPAVAVAWVAALAVGSWTIESRLRNLVILAGVVAIVWTPWLARNSVVHGQPLITTRYWLSAWSASNPSASGSDRLALTPARREAGRRMVSWATVEPGGDSDGAARIELTQLDLLTPPQRAALHGQPESAREALFARWTREITDAGESRRLSQWPTRLAKAWFVDWDHPMSRHPLAWSRWLIGALALGALPVIAVRRVGVGGAIGVVLLCWTGWQSATLASARQSIAMEPLQIALIAIAAVGMMKRGSAVISAGRVEAVGDAIAPVGGRA